MNHRSINWQPAILEENLVKLIPLKKSDFERLYAIASDPVIWEQHPAGDRYKKEVFKTFFDGAISCGTAFLILDKSENAVIGSTRYYDYNAENSSIAIGYTFLATRYWGGHYNKPVKKLLLDYAFQFVQQVNFHIGPLNLRSQKATEKIGAVKVREFEAADGDQSLRFEYRISKEDWLREGW